MSPRRSNVAEILPLEDDEVDPVWAAFERAPLARKVESDEQRKLVELARRGPFRPGDVVSAEIAARCEHGD
jgi:hypothetical protein